MILTKVVKSIRANILVGVFLTVPVVVTILIFRFLFNLGTNWLPPEMFLNLRGIPGGEFMLRVLTLLTIIVTFYFVGLLTRNFIGRHLYQISDKILANIPFIKGIYISVRQISESLFTQRKTLFKEVVLVEFPRKGLFSIGFVTAQAPRLAARHIPESSHPEPCVSVFIPTTPNPTSGFLFMAPRSEIVPLNMPVSEALTFVMSAGAVGPGEDGSVGQPTLLDKLEEWLSRGGDDSLPSPEKPDAATQKP